MHDQPFVGGGRHPSRVAGGLARKSRVIFALGVAVLGFSSIPLGTRCLRAANSAADPAATAIPAGGTATLATHLGVRFVSGSSSKVMIEKDGKTYLVDLAAKTVQLEDSPSASSPGVAPRAEGLPSAPQAAPGHPGAVLRGGGV